MPKTPKTPDTNTTSEATLTRRAALRRIATVAAGAAVGGALLAEARPAAAQQGRYISIEGSYVNTVYADYKNTNYNDKFTYYTSYSSHRVYVPPPYTGGKR